MNYLRKTHEYDMICRAREVLVCVHGRDDVAHVRITKTEAVRQLPYLLRAGCSFEYLSGTLTIDSFG